MVKQTLRKIMSKTVLNIGDHSTADAYYAKKITNEILIDPSILWRNES